MAKPCLGRSGWARRVRATTTAPVSGAPHRQVGPPTFASWVTLHKWGLWGHSLWLGHSPLRGQATHVAPAPTRSTLGPGSQRCRPKIKNRFSTRLGLGFTHSMTVSSWPCLEDMQPAAATWEPGSGPTLCPCPQLLRSEVQAARLHMAPHPLPHAPRGFLQAGPHPPGMAWKEAREAALGLRFRAVPAISPQARPLPCTLQPGDPSSPAAHACPPPCAGNRHQRTAASVSILVPVLRHISQRDTQKIPCSPRLSAGPCTSLLRTGLQASDPARSCQTGVPSPGLAPYQGEAAHRAQPNPRCRAAGLRAGCTPELRECSSTMARNPASVHGPKGAERVGAPWLAPSSETEGTGTLWVARPPPTPSANMGLAQPQWVLPHGTQVSASLPRL